jgi:ankyrin repeat protein
MIYLLIDNKTEVGLVDKLGRIPLHYSTSLGYGAATRLLIDRGVVVITEDSDRRTARNIPKRQIQTVQ